MKNQIMKSAGIKYLIVLLMTVVLTHSLSAQDVIVTNEGDTLNCKITNIKSDNILFTFRYNGEIRNSLLPLSKVKFYQRDYYQKSEVPKGSTVGNKFYPHFRLAINGGWSYRIAGLPDNIQTELKQYLKGLKSGYDIGLDMSYFFSEQYGIGLKYSYDGAKNELSDIYVTLPDGTIKTGMMSDDISINYVGPFFAMRYLNASQKNGLLMNLGLGYTAYKNDAVMIDSYRITGNTLGLGIEIGYDFGISDNFAVGIMASYLSGVLIKVVVNDGTNIETVTLDKGSYENLARINLTIGLRFIK